MSEPVLRYETEGGVVVLTLNRPGKRNALNRALVEALMDGLERAGRQGARVVAIRGAGPDFCSGADLAELEEAADAGVEESLSDAGRLGELFVALRHHPAPVVAVVHGRALAGGCGLATACDLVLAREDAQLGYPEVHLGFVPAMVMAILRRKVPEAKAFELVARGERIGAADARAIGLVNRALAEEGFEEAVRDYLESLASRPASAVALSKRLLYGLDATGFEEGVRRGAEVNALARRTRECREGVRRFLEEKSSS